MLAGKRTKFVYAVAAATAACALLVAGPQPAAAGPLDPGEATLMLNAKSSFDPFLTEAAPRTREFARERYWRMRAYPPFFDRALGWAAPAHFYKDLYAIYKSENSELIGQHPDWVLRDAQGSPLYIQFDCAAGTCPQYAADIGSPSWRRHWIEQARQELAKGYVGIFIDDVNMEMRVSDGSGRFTRPVDPRTGAPMTDADWRRYVAEFTEQIRAAFPSAEIIHNALWWADHSDPYVQREIAAASAIELERAFSDEGLTRGGGTFGFTTFIRHIEWLHARGKAVVYEPVDLSEESTREFELASYFLLQERGDVFSVDEDGGAFPDRWWDGWDTDLGAPRGSYRFRDGVLTRRFARGQVIVSQPGASSKRIRLSRKYVRLSGRKVDSVRVADGQGAILLRQGTTTTRR
jgi:Hypothetical glycosyl hydrolase family 15